MKGLMFNVLETLAHDAGCSDEAWELVVEFAAAEALLDQATDPAASLARRPSRSPHSYVSPTEAMVRCLSQGDQGEQRSWDLLDAAQHQEWFASEWTVSAASRGNVYEQAHYGAGFTAEAFLEPEVLLNSWRRDSEPPPVDPSWEEEAQAEEWIRQQKAANKRRG